MPFQRTVQAGRLCYGVFQYRGKRRVAAAIAADAQCACQPSVSYYAPAATTAYDAPATTAYYAPTTAYYAPQVTAYYAPTTAYYAAPVTSYYAPVYRPGLFGWRARRAFWSGVPVATPY